MQPYQIIAELDATDSKLEKQAIIEREAKAGNVEFFAGISLCMDPMVTFGVKKVEFKSEPKKGEAEPRGLKFETFAALCDKLAKRELSGDAAGVAIAHARLQATAEQWDGWYRRILIKDMKAGFGESTVNKVCEKKYPQFAIQIFETQLAKDSGGEEVTGMKMVDTKLDGMRCITIVYPTGEVQQFSRNGKVLENFEVIRKQLSKQAVFFQEPTVLDGEVMSKSFQDLMKQARRKSDVQADDCVLNLFDIITLAEFKAGIGKHRQIDRSYSLAVWYEQLKDHLPNVNVLGNELLDLDTPEGQERLSEINRTALEVGAEGIMMKDPEAVYECTRSKNWLKLKPWIEESLTVVDVEEGKADSKFVGTMGALVCEGEVDGKKVHVNVGGGYSIQQRAQIWATHTGQPVEWKKKVKGKWVTYTEQPEGEDVIGRIAEVRADALTKSQDSDVYSMRFPRFKTWRGFAAGEKL